MERHFLFFPAFLRFIIYLTLGVMIYMNITALGNYRNSNTITIEHPKPSCTDNTDVPILPQQKINVCNTLDLTGSYLIYSPLPTYRYIISDKPRYFAQACATLCSNENRTTVGGCNSSRYDSCISEIEPAKNCNNSARPIGIYNGKPYYIYSYSNDPTVCPNFD